MTTAVPTALRPIRHLVLVLGDQLNRDASAFDGFDPAHDVVWMAEVAEESTHVWSSKQRTVLFLAAMRHHAAALRADGLPLVYRQPADGSFADALASTLTGELAPEGIVVTEPGDWRVLQQLRGAAEAHGLPIDIRPDRHFLCSTAAFGAYAKARKALHLETFYRALRLRHRVLMDEAADGAPLPCGGRWNYDTENRAGFGSGGPGFLPAPPRFAPDAITRTAIDDVETRYADHPGSSTGFGWPVTRADALVALDAFIADRLPLFGHWQDAMWTGEPWLYHAQLSSSLNLKLLDPREVVARAEAAYREGLVPIAAAEGFIRQILGWREYVRGAYWLDMPGYLQHNALDAHEPLPAWYWTGQTNRRCLADAIGQTLEHGYAHHIQRLMVTGLYALLLGVEPAAVHGWYLAVYVDAVEWAELPNTFGLSQYADGGRIASKPYIASGRYIDRQSDHCRRCRFDPAQRSGDRACPFTTLYWDFVARHAARLGRNPRTAAMVRNLARIDPAERAAIADRAARIRSGAV
jgi:deoxyribodipyrimidine photolyase-related protein